MDTNNANFKKYYDTNNFVVSGRLTRDPEIRTAPSGNTYATVTIANNRGDNTNFFTFFASAAQIPFVQSSLHKGCAVDISGSILPQTETQPDGKKITTYKLIASKFALVAQPRSATGESRPTNGATEHNFSAPAGNYQNRPQYQNNQPQYQQNQAPQYNNAPPMQNNGGYQQPQQGQYANPGFQAPQTQTNNFDDDLPF